MTGTFHDDLSHVQDSQTSEPASAPSQDVAYLTSQVQSLQAAISRQQSELQKTQRLRSQVNWLTGALVASIVVLGGALGGFVLNLKMSQADLQAQQQQLAEQFQAMEGAQASVEEAQQLKEEIAALNRQATVLSTDIQALIEELPNERTPQFEAIQQRLQELETSIRNEISSQSIRARFDNLYNLLQDVLRPQSESETPTSPAETSLDEVPSSEEIPGN